MSHNGPMPKFMQSVQHAQAVRPAGYAGDQQCAGLNSTLGAQQAFNLWKHLASRPARPPTVASGLVQLHQDAACGFGMHERISPGPAFAAGFFIDEANPARFEL